MTEQEGSKPLFGFNPNGPVPGASRPHIDLDAMVQGSSADRGSHFSITSPDNPVRSFTSSAAQPGTSGFGRGPSSSEQDRYGSHFSLSPSNLVDPTGVGIFRSTLLPSIGFHSGLAVVVYAASRAAGRVDGKDWLWPTGQVLNAWWGAVGARALNDNISFGTAYSHLGYTEKLLLTGVTAWGARVFYRVGSRSLKRTRDDPRYDEAKREDGFWNKAFFSIFLPEALYQAVISLPFTLPFRALDDSAVASPLHVHPEYTYGFAVALFSAGFALELLADAQRSAHRKTNPDELIRTGVWSIVRHPNYLGDALIHASFPLLLWSAGIMHPLVLLGPIANYFFLVGGESESEAAEAEKYERRHQKKHTQLLEYQSQKNSFWPKTEEIHNPWTWAVLAFGFGGFVLERGFRGYVNRV